MAILQLFLAIFLPTVYIFIFHKTEVQTVNLMCLTGLKSDWFKGYDTKCKYFHFHFFCNFVQKHSFAFFAFLRFVSYLLYQSRFRLVKHLKMTVWTSVLWKKNIQLAKKWPDMVVKWPFINCYFLRVGQASARPPSTSEAITLEPIKI